MAGNAAASGFPPPPLKKLAVEVAELLKARKQTLSVVETVSYVSLAGYLSSTWDFAWRTEAFRLLGRLQEVSSPRPYFPLLEPAASSKAVLRYIRWKAGCCTPVGRSSTSTTIEAQQRTS